MQRKWLIAFPIILVLLALCAGMTFILWRTTSRLALANLTIDGVSIPIFGAARVSAEAEENKTFSVQAPAELWVDSPCGDVTVAAAEDGQIDITAHKKAWGRNDQQAQANLALIKLRLTQEGNTVRVGLEDPEQGCQTSDLTRLPLQVDYTLRVPVQTAVQVHTRNGNIHLNGTEGRAELTSRFGDVNAEEVTGRLTINTQNGKITARQVQAGEDPIQLKTSFGNVILEHSAAGSLSVITSNGALNLNTVAISGTVTLTSDFGDIAWQQGQGSSLETRSKNGKISLQDLALNGSLGASSDFGDLSLKAVRAESYAVTTKNGKVILDGVAGKVTAHSDFGDLTVTGDGALDFDLSSENGAISVQGALGQGDHVIRTRFGNIAVSLPEQSAFNFDLQTRFGKISSDFPITIQGSPNETHWQGTTNGGGPNLTASTQNGNIRLRYLP